MLHIDIGLSALKANQQALYTISNNIANANTDGYHRQRAEFSDRQAVTSGNLLVGSGVDVSGITRMKDGTTEVSLIATGSLQSQSETLLQILKQVETALLPTQGSLTDSVSNFFNQIEQLAAQPSEVTVRDAVVASGQQVIDQINSLESRLNQLLRDNANSIQQDVSLTNQTADDIAVLNQKIRLIENQGRQPNQLYDERDRLIGQLAQFVDISSVSLLTSGSPLLAAGGSIAIGERASHLNVDIAGDGTPKFSTQGGHHVAMPVSGSLAGRAEGQQALIDVRDSLHEWINAFVSEIDHIQATGLGQNQSTQDFVGARSISDPNAVLSELGLPFPLDAGSLFITTTDVSTETRQTEKIDFDPETETLNDLLAKINSLPNISATYHAEQGTVSISAATGYVLDFAGGVDPTPASSTLSGTSSATLSGIPSGTVNRALTATIVGTGTIGTTPGLKAEITDSVSGTLITTIDLGESYSPGSRVSIVDGVQIAFSEGAVNDAETIQFDVVNEPDETGVLTALGIQTFFKGDAQTGISLSPTIKGSSQHVAISRTGASGDSSNATRFIAARDLRRFADGQETFEERLNSLTVSIAFQIQTEESGLAYLDGQKLQLEDARAAVSGVDPNEELLLMLEYQRAFQAASKFVTAVNATLDDLFLLIR